MRRCSCGCCEDWKAHAASEITEVLFLIYEARKPEAYNSAEEAHKVRKRFRLDAVFQRMRIRKFRFIDLYFRPLLMNLAVLFIQGVFSSVLEKAPENEKDSTVCKGE